MDAIYLSHLKIENFRNLENSPIQFSKGLNCIFGANGNGKTNLLEAIYLITNGKSFKKNTGFPQYLSMDGEKPEIIFSSLFSSEISQIQYSGKIYGQGTKNWQSHLNGEKKRFKLSSVFVNPFDSHSFHLSTTQRRTWFDHHFSMLSDSYKKDCRYLQQSLKQRNKLLTQFGSRDQLNRQLDAVDLNLAQVNSRLLKMRNEFLEELAPRMEEVFKQIFSEKHTLSIRLESNLSSQSADQIFQQMRQNREQDFLTRVSRIGAHRDDYLPTFDGLNSLEYCSLGQQKMSYLSLIFAYIDLFRYKFLAYPIVLIDDVSGELDRHRWGRLVDYLKEKKFQVFITTANEAFKHELEKVENSHKMAVNLGVITQYQ